MTRVGTLSAALIAVATAFGAPARAETAGAGGSTPTAQTKITPLLSEAKVAPAIREAPAPQPSAKPVEATPPVRSVKLAARGTKTESLRVPLQLDNLAPEALKVTSGKAELTRDAAGSMVLELPPNQEVVVAPAHAQPPVDLNPERKHELAGALVRAVSSGNQVLLQTVRLFIELAHAVTWDGKSYVAKLLVGLDPPDGPMDSIDLDTPLEVSFSSSAARIDPGGARLERFGPGGYREVSVYVAPTSAGGNLRVNVHSLVGHQAFDFPVERRPALLSLESSSEEITGLGVGSAALTLRLLAVDGLPVVATAPLDVTFKVNHGALSVPSVTLDRNRSTAQIEYQAARLGIAEITPSAAGLTSKSARLRLTFPWLELAVAVAAGLAGGLLRRYRRAPDAGPRSVWSLGAEGSLSALVVYGVVLALPMSVGINPRVLTTALGAFAVGTAAGFFGAALLDTLLRRVLRTEEKPDSP